MGVINLPSGTNTQDINVNGTSVSVASGTALILDGSISGWNHTSIIQETPYRRKVQFLRNDKKALMRLENDEEGFHIHYDNFDEDGFQIKIHKPAITFEVFLRNPLKFKNLANGFIKSVRKKDKSSE